LSGIDGFIMASNINPIDNRSEILSKSR